MTARRLAPWCLAPVCLLAALLPAPAQEKAGDAAPLKFRIYGSLLPGYKKSDANGFTQPMFDFLSRKVGHRIESDVYEGTTRDDLFEFGKKLNKGEYHLAAVWGVEYGWLRAEYPNLKVLTVVSTGDKDSLTQTLVLVRKDSGATKLTDLKGKRLAVYKDTPLMDRAYLQKMLSDEQLAPKGFFQKTEPLATVKSAVFAVKSGKADCVVLNSMTFTRLKRVTGLGDALVELKVGEAYPLPVLIGSPDLVNGLRKKKGKLWDDLREQCLDVHNSPEGKECINFWRFQSFVSPDADYQRKVDAATRKLPVEVLLNLE